MPTSQKKNNMPINKFLLSLFLIFFIGCGELVSVKKYDTDFFITQPISLHVEDSLLKEDINALLIAAGFVIDEGSSIQLEVTRDPINTNCTLTNPKMAKETFIRISVVQNEEERYRIQRNQKGEMLLNDIEKVVKKMGDDLKK